MSQEMTKRRRRRGCVNVDRVKAYIEANHCKRLTWDHLEQRFNRSRSAIHAALKRHVGKGFMELLHQARIREARYMLRRSRLTLPAIGGHASRWGLLDCFKRLNGGLTPSRYRKRYRHQNRFIPKRR